MGNTPQKERLSWLLVLTIDKDDDYDDDDDDGEMKWWQKKFKKVVECFIIYFRLHLKVICIAVVDINNAV